MKLLAVILISITANSFAQQSSVLDNLSWLIGCWSTHDSYYITREHWMPPDGGMMVGISHTVSKGETLGYEYLRIEERAGKLVYIANPSGQAETEFMQTELNENSVIFENLSHDFPQRIIYKLLPDGSIYARVEGEKDGKMEGFDIPMKSVDCLK